MTTVKLAELVLSCRELKPSKVSLTQTADFRDEAAALVDELKFNEGEQN